MTQFHLNLNVIQQSDERTRFALLLTNHSQETLADWSLHFSITRHLDSQSNTQGNLSQLGSFCRLDTLPPVEQNGVFRTEFEMVTPPLRLQCDGILEAYLVHKDEQFSVSVTPISLQTPYAKKEAVEVVEEASIAIIPKPNELTVGEGHFQFASGEVLALTDSCATHAALWLCECKPELKLTLTQASDSKPSRVNFIKLVGIDEQAYQLEVTSEGVTIHASTAQGFNHAVASLLQLLRAGNTVPSVQISDAPAYPYRGMMLDCSRHFHTVEQVKLTIDQLARYKYNHFHWHLTDDEGWRLEIKAFPELTEIGAWRGPDLPLTSQFRQIDAEYGGFYTQEEVKEVIAYATRRGVTVIPEIDIPGHCRAAIKALPDLLLDTEDHSVYRSVQHYTDNVLSPALAGTYQFLDTVMEEVAQLFPAPYVHVGADEVPEGVWTNSVKCQEFMKQHGYQDTKELQGHLLRHVETKLNSLNKRMLGWEEVQYGDKVSQQTVIYSWQSEQAAIECARKGFDVVLQPGQYTYLDMAQEFDQGESGFYWANVTPLKHAYHYQPLSEIAADDPIHSKVWGIQSALWCELVNDAEKLQYMVYPRLQAIAEVSWTHAGNKQWLDFLSRLKVDLKGLESRGIHYRDPWL